MDSDSEIKRMIDEAASGHLLAVHAIYSQWLIRQRPDLSGSIFSQNLHPALVEAVRNNHVSVVTYLLSRGLKLNSGLVEIGMINRSTEMLQVFLDHGWDINKPRERSLPPPLM